MSQATTISTAKNTGKFAGKFTGKIALVTGGTSGIGLETARLLQSAGASVIVTGVNPDRLAATAAELGSTALVLKADLLRAGDIDPVIAAIRQRFGRLDILFANAGVGTATPLEAVTDAQIDEIFAINVKGIFFAVQQSVPLMGKGGAIVLTTSFLNAVGTPGLSVLSASKAAARSLVRSFAAELAPRGIRVNAVSPGPISTPFHAKLGLSADQLTEVAAGIEAKVPMHRFGEANEVAKAVLFLASDDASYMTGTEIAVDGGLTQL